MRKRVLAVLLILTLIITGCGSKGNSSQTDADGTETNAATVNTTNAPADDTAADTSATGGTEDSDAANTAVGSVGIEFTSEKEATFTITSEAFSRNFEDIAGASQEDYFELYSWDVRFGDFKVHAAIRNMQLASYSTAELNCSIVYVQKMEDGYDMTWEIKSLESSISGNTLVVKAVLPDEVELSAVQGADAATIATYSFDEAQEFILSETQLNNVLYEASFSREEIASTAPVIDEVFPDEVYADGFTPTGLDAVLFAPATTNYVIYDGSKSNDGIIAVDRKILLVFSQAGRLLDGYTRYGHYTGAESTSEGIVATKADASTMQMYSDEMIQDGYTLGLTTSLQQGEFVTDANYLYVRWKQETLDQIDARTSGYGYMTAAEWAQNTPNDLLLVADAADYGTDYSPFYISEMTIDNTAPLAENYCSPEDFRYLSYVTAASDDYYIVEYPSYADIYFFDETGAGIQMVTIQESTDAENYDYLIAGGYNKVEGSDTLVYSAWEGTSSDKSSMLTIFINTFVDKTLQSYDQSMRDYGFVVYMSKPWAGN